MGSCPLVPPFHTLSQPPTEEDSDYFISMTSPHCPDTTLSFLNPNRFSYGHGARCGRIGDSSKSPACLEESVALGRENQIYTEPVRILHSKYSINKIKCPAPYH